MLASPLAGSAFGIVLLCWLLANVLFRRSSRLAYGLCMRHRQMERLRWIALVPIWTSAVLLALHSSDMAVWSIVLIVLLLLVADGLQTLRVRHIALTFTRFSGCGEAFLSSLPELPIRESASTR